MVDAIHHLIVLGDDMSEEILRNTLSLRTYITGTGIVGQTTGLTHLLEHDTIHATTEVLVEHSLYSCLIDIPVALLIMVGAHVDVLGIEGSNPHFVLVGLLLHIVVGLGHSLEFLGCLVTLVDDG